MANRDEILRELKVEEICHPLGDGANPEDISVNYGKFKYNQPNNFTDPRDIPDLGFVQYLISLGGGGLITQPYTQADLLYDGTLLQYYLPVTLTSTQLVVAVSSTESGTKDQIQFSVIDDKIFGFASNSVQNIIVKIG